MATKEWGLTTIKVAAEEYIPDHPFFLPASIRGGRKKLIHEPYVD
jgi:hypothetical protein